MNNNTLNMKQSLTTMLIGALIIGAAAVSNAQDKQTLDLLVSKGIITKEEATSVAKNSVAISAKEKTTKAIKLTGRVQMQYENIGVTEYTNGVSNELSTKSDFLMRRMFLGMDADIGSGWSALVIADFARSSDNYLEYAYISKKIDMDFLTGKADFGYRKVIFALSEYTSASRLQTIERSLATRYFTEGNNGRRLGIGGRHTGVYWNGKIKEVEGLTYGLSVTNGYSNSPTSVPENATNNLLYCLNGAYAGKFENGSYQFGLNLAYTNGVNVAGTAGSAEGAIYAANPYVKLDLYGFEIWSEFLISQIENGKSKFTKDAMPMGVNVVAEYKFDVGEFGKVAPVLAYSWIDTDGRGIKMSDGIRNSPAQSTYNAGQSIYAGINWYINGNSLKFQLGYEWAQLNGSTSNTGVSQYADANAIRAQVQALF